jgi:hypothetical protein
MNHNRLGAWLGYIKKYPNTVVALLFLLILLVCFQPLLWGHATIKWDAFRLWLPWKHFIVEELLNGQLPLWNPFMNNGFPQHGDTMTWYPISWIIGFIHGGYNLSALNTEYLFHLFTAGFGFYTFSARFNDSKRVRFFLGLSYMLSGLMIGNAQHMAWIISAAWLPWYFLSLAELVEQVSLRRILRFSLVGFFLFSGGYLAMFFVVIYCSVFYVGWKIYRQPTNKQRLNRIATLLLSVFIIALLSAPLLYSVYEIFPLFNRFNPDSTIDINLGGTPLIGVLATILPLASGMFNIEEFQFGTFSAFFGTIPFVLIIVLVFRKSSSKKSLILFLLGCLFLLLSLSDYLPLRSWIGHLPLLDLFRYPSLFRLFFIFFLLWSLGELLKNQTITGLIPVNKKWIFLFVGAALVFVSIGCFLYSTESEFGEACGRFFSSHTNYPVDVWFRCGINTAFFGVFTLLLFGIVYFSANKFWGHLILLFWGMELFFVANWAAPLVVYEPTNIQYANTMIDFQPKQTPSILENHQELELEKWRGYADFAWGGKTNFLKQLSGLWFNPLSLHTSNNRTDVSIPEDYPLYGVITKSGELTLDTPEIKLFSNQHWTVSVPQQLASGEHYFYIKQMMIPNWKVEPTNELFASKEGFMLVPLKNSPSSFELTYDSQMYWWLFYVFLIVFVILICLLIVLSVGRWRYLVALLLLITVSGIHWQKRSASASSNAFKLITHQDLPLFTNPEYWKALPSAVSISGSFTHSDQFLHFMNYHYPIIEGCIQHQDGELLVLKQSLYPKKSLLEIDLKRFIQESYSTDLTTLLRKKQLRNKAPYLVLEYLANPETTAQLWLVRSNDKGWINGIALDLAAHQSTEETKQLIHRVDLSRYTPQHNETVKLFIWGEGDISDVEVLSLKLVKH